MEIEEKIFEMIKKITINKEKQEKIRKLIEMYNECKLTENSFWYRQCYKLGFLDGIYLKKELQELNENFPKKEKSI